MGADRRYNAGMDNSIQETQKTSSRRWQFSIAGLLVVTTAAALLAGLAVWLIPRPRDYTCHPVTGRVVLTDGTPIQEGVIEFVSPDLSLFAISEITNGQFQLAISSDDVGCPVGEYLVVVSSAIPNPHGRYDSPETTDIVVVVKRKKNEFVIKLDPAE
ncbi:MAG: hypothetical protein RIC55_21735 [Pirellulaceae bacterium]